MKYFSMFSGIGGFEHAIQKLCSERTQIYKPGAEAGDQEGQLEQLPEQPGGQGLPCIGYSEIDPYAIKVYERTFKHKGYGDATRIIPEQLPDFDILVGGFPCQAFSIAGKRGGFNDTRGTMFFEIARIVKEKRPRLLVLENVKGILSHDQGNTYATIISALDELGYDTERQTLNSKNFGVPQNRERVFIVGHLRGQPSRKVFPIEGKTNGSLQELTQGVSDSQRIYDPAGISSTITGNGGGLGAKTGLYELGYRVRRLTPKECERLQGIPDNTTEGFSDKQRYKLTGNAVTVNVVEAIMDRLI